MKQYDIKPPIEKDHMSNHSHQKRMILSRTQKRTVPPIHLFREQRWVSTAGNAGGVKSPAETYLTETFRNPSYSLLGQFSSSIFFFTFSVCCL